MLERHHEMADRHQGGAEDDGAALAEHAVGEQAAEDRRQIDEPGVEAVDLRGEGLQVERSEHRFQRLFERGKAEHATGLRRLQQILDHIEDKQRAHPVIGEALPHLGGEQEGQRARMAEQVAGGVVVAGDGFDRAIRRHAGLDPAIHHGVLL